MRQKLTNLQIQAYEEFYNDIAPVDSMHSSIYGDFWDSVGGKNFTRVMSFIGSDIDPSFERRKYKLLKDILCDVDETKYDTTIVYSHSDTKLGYDVHLKYDRIIFDGKDFIKISYSIQNYIYPNDINDNVFHEIVKFPLQWDTSQDQIYREQYLEENIRERSGGILDDFYLYLIPTSQYGDFKIIMNDNDTSPLENVADYDHNPEYRNGGISYFTPTRNYFIYDVLDVVNNKQKSIDLYDGEWINCDDEKVEILKTHLEIRIDNIHTKEFFDILENNSRIPLRYIDDLIELIQHEMERTFYISDSDKRFAKQVIIRKQTEAYLNLIILPYRNIYYLFTQNLYDIIPFYLDIILSVNSVDEADKYLNFVKFANVEEGQSYQYKDKHEFWFLSNHFVPIDLVIRLLYSYREVKGKSFVLERQLVNYTNNINRVYMEKAMEYEWPFITDRNYVRGHGGRTELFMLSTIIMKVVNIPDFFTKLDYICETNILGYKEFFLMIDKWVARKTKYSINIVLSLNILLNRIIKNNTDKNKYIKTIEVINQLTFLECTGPYDFTIYGESYKRSFIHLDNLSFFLLVADRLDENILNKCLEYFINLSLPSMYISIHDGKKYIGYVNRYYDDKFIGYGENWNDYWRLNNLSIASSIGNGYLLDYLKNIIIFFMIPLIWENKMTIDHFDQLNQISEPFRTPEGQEHIKIFFEKYDQERGVVDRTLYDTVRNQTLQYLQDIKHG